MSLARRLAALGLALATVLTLSAQTGTVPVLSQTMPDQSLAVETGSLTVDLRGLFNVPGVTGTIVQFTTDLGRFNVELLANDAPLSVANFLSYVNDGSYNGTIIHRSTPLNQVNGAYVNGIIQGGGYTYAPPPATVIKKPAIKLEYKLANARGMIAFARTSVLDSATSEWFINQDDNSTILGASNGGGYAVFGRVLGTGMTVVDGIYGLPTYNVTQLNAAFTNLPLRNYDNVNKPAIQLSNLVDVSNISVIPIYPTAGGGTSLINFNATSSATSVATVALSGSNLVITPVSPGTSSITVSALDVNGNGIAGSFLAAVQAFAPPAITTQPQGHTVAIGSTAVLSVGVTGTALTYQWMKNGNILTGATSSRLVVTTAQAGDTGDYSVTVGGPNNTSVTSSAATLNVVASAEPGRIVNLSIRATSGTGNRVLIMGFVTGGDGTSGNTPLLIRGVGPSIKSEVPDALADPIIQVIAQGDSTAIANNDNWNGDAAVKAAASVTGAFALLSDTSKDAALLKDLPRNLYSVIVSDTGGATGTVLAEMYDAGVAPGYNPATPRLVNLSARAYLSATDVLIAGFVVSGQTAKTVLIRAIGPNPAFVAAVGSEALADPRLTLNHQMSGTNTVIKSNDNWGGDAQITNAGQQVGADTLTNPASKDAAILVTLDPGVYSAVAYGANSSAGILLVEVYDVP